MLEHPEDLEKIEKLKDLIAWQVSLKQSVVFSSVFVCCVYLSVLPQILQFKETDLGPACHKLFTLKK